MNRNSRNRESLWQRGIGLVAPCVLVLILASPGFGQGYYYGRRYYYPWYGRRRPAATPRPNPADYRAKRETPRPVKKKKKETDPTDRKVPTADLSEVHGPFVAYIWNDHDSLSRVAHAGGLTTNQLLALNDLSYGELQSGQVFRLPETTATESLADKASQQAREIWRGIRGGKRVALSFDAGGEADGIDLLLGNLADAGIPATFFATGEFASAHKDIIKKISRAGYPIHNHSWSHPDFTKIPGDEVADQLNRTDRLVDQLTSHSTKPFFRPPFGASNREVYRIAAEQGFQSVYWTLDSLDSVGDKKSSDFVVNRVLDPPSHGMGTEHFLDGAIILMHVGEKGSAGAVPRIVKGLHDRGFSFVTVDEIIQPPDR